MLYTPDSYKIITTPVGRLCLTASDKGVTGLWFESPRHGAATADMQENANHPVLLRAEKQLAEYFEGKRKNFDLRLDLRGTVFQLMAWKALQTIPYGQTISYADQAGRVGDAKKARAVGMANNRNPISIIVPCHRVVGKSGSLTGYGGGLDVKEFLLGHEARYA